MAYGDLFREGEGLRFFDYYAEGSKGRHYRTFPHKEVSRAETAVAAFREEICTSYRRRDGSGASCHIEFMERRAEGTTQVTVYVEGLPNHATDLVNGDFKRLVAHPTIDAAIVYDPRDGHTTTVAKGGAPVHEMLREAFARKLLGIEPKFDVIMRRRFRLESLKTARSFEADPTDGIKAVRVRKLSLAPQAMGVAASRSKLRRANTAPGSTTLVTAGLLSRVGCSKNSMSSTRRSASNFTRSHKPSEPGQSTLSSLRIRQTSTT